MFLIVYSKGKYVNGIRKKKKKLSTFHPSVAKENVLSLNLIQIKLHVYPS